LLSNYGVFILACYKKQNLKALRLFGPWVPTFGSKKPGILAGRVGLDHDFRGSCPKILTGVQLCCHAYVQSIDLCHIDTRKSEVSTFAYRIFAYNERPIAARCRTKSGSKQRCRVESKSPSSIRQGRRIRLHIVQIYNKSKNAVWAYVYRMPSSTGPGPILGPERHGVWVICLGGGISRAS